MFLQAAVFLACATAVSAIKFTDDFISTFRNATYGEPTNITWSLANGPVTITLDQISTSLLRPRFLGLDSSSVDPYWGNGPMLFNVPIETIACMFESC